MAAEYIVSSGNPNVILCERGIRTFETYTRNTMDLSAVPLLHHLTHLPVIVDPSHATGQALARPAARDRRRRGRGRRRHGRGPSRPRRGALGRRAAADARPVRATDGRARPGPRARPRRSTATRSSPAPRWASAVRRRALEALGAADDRRHRRPSRSVVRPRPGSAASCRCPATSRSATGRCMLAPLAAGESPDRRAPATARTSARRRAIVARARARTSARRATTRRATRRLPRRRRRASTGSREPGGRPRLRQLRDEPPAVRRDPRRPADPDAILDGDASLRRRPVARIIEPLRSMGAALHARRATPSHRSP